jgi:hypothetical protein
MPESMHSFLTTGLWPPTTLRYCVSARKTRTNCISETERRWARMRTLVFGSHHQNCASVVKENCAKRKVRHTSWYVCELRSSGMWQPVDWYKHRHFGGAFSLTSRSRKSKKNRDPEDGGRNLMRSVGNNIHGVISQDPVIFVSTAVRTSDLVWYR